MTRGLQIPNARERRMVALADWVARPLAWRRRAATTAPSRILLLRLERIGDLLMVLDAIGLARELAPAATIDLAVGSWNADLAAIVPGVDRVHLLDVPWLARDDRRSSWPALMREARSWRRHAYDLAINFEPDIRSNVLSWLSGARRRAGYWTGGGGAFLTEADAYDPTAHVRTNAERLVRRALRASDGREGPAPQRLRLPDEARATADAALPARGIRLVGVHASGGRPSKQWHPERFGDAAREISRRHGATVVLTGGPADRPLVDAVKAHLTGVPVVDVCGALELPALAAILARLDLFVTGDTGPMHLASAVGTPIVALFGPSDPRRYGPAGTTHEIVHTDVWCRPCGLVRQPPERCRDRVPDCLDGIDVAAVVAAADRVLAAAAARPRQGAI